MRATLRITWLLLSLSFLFHNARSEDTTAAATAAATTAAAPTTAVIKTIDNSNPKTTGPSGTTAAAPTTADASIKPPPTQAATQPPVAVADATIATTAAAKPASTQPQTTTVSNNPPTQPGVTDGPAPVITVAAPSAATTSLPKITNPPVTDDRSASSVVSTKATTVQTPGAAVPSKTPEAPVSVAGTPGNVGTTKAPTVPPDTPTTQLSNTHIAITSITSQGDSKGGTTEVPKTTPQLTTLKPTEQAGNSGTTLTPTSQTNAGPPAVVTTNTKAGTTSPPATTTTTTTVTTTTTSATPKKFVYSLLSGQETKEEKDLAEVCRRLMPNWQNGTCTLTWRHHNGKVQFDCVEINGKVKTDLAAQYYEEITKKPTDNKTLIAILASCGALLIMIVILAVCASHHRRPYNENQQHLTEELHTVENGYHDNPTLEVMEVQPEMQEKKMALNGEFNDSWIVPIDNLLKEDIPDEEDTHL